MSKKPIQKITDADGKTSRLLRRGCRAASYPVPRLSFRPLYVSAIPAEAEDCRRAPVRWRRQVGPPKKAR